MSKDTVQDGLVVSMDYKLTVDGELLDSSDDAGPLQFLVGYGNIIPGLEKEMMGMKIGDSKDVVVQPADGYGEFDEEAFMDVPRGQFPKDMNLEVGAELTVRDNDDHARFALVDSIEGETVTLNFNHPLAGDELHFHVKVCGFSDDDERSTVTSTGRTSSLNAQTKVVIQRQRYRAGGHRLIHAQLRT
jgi:FKBP-type peptidyl-prolyl cis-trans isomerase SlyD